LIDDAVAIVRTSDGDSQLAAYVVSNDDTLDVDSLRGWLGERLPHYMVPAVVACVPAWPLTANGKLDRAKLPPSTTRPAQVGRATPPETELERVVSGIWSELLNVDDVGIDGNFFELGGNSVLAIRACSRLRERCASGLSLVTLFQYPTVRALARHLATVDDTGRLPTSGQQGRSRVARRDPRVGRERRLAAHAKRTNGAAKTH
jgi:hypothetical protein